MLEGMKLLCAFLLVCLSACSHAPADSDTLKASDAAIAALTKPAADQRLAEVQKRIEALDERVAASRARRDNLQSQASTDVTKQPAVDGAEAELATLQQRRAALQHEERALEARLRELAD